MRQAYYVHTNRLERVEPTTLSFSGYPSSNLPSDLRLNDHMVDLIEGGFM